MMSEDGQLKACLGFKGNKEKQREKRKDMLREQKMYLFSGLHL